MIKLKSLILERESYENHSRSVSIDEHTVETKLHTDHLHALEKYKEGFRIYRGIYSETSYFFVQPSQFTRKSANTSNFYTSLIDILPSWKDWPKRSKSIICTCNRGGTSAYGRRYIVFPKNGSKIGVCLVGDFWNSFPLVNTRLGTCDMDGFNSMFQSFFHSNNIDFNSNFSNIEEYIIKLNWLLKSGNTIFNSDTTLKKDMQENLKGNWLQYFDELMDPEKNKFMLKTMENYDVSFDYNKEVWTDGDSVLVSSETGKSVINQLT